MSWALGKKNGGFFSRQYAYELITHFFSKLIHNIDMIKDVFIVAINLHVLLKIKILHPVKDLLLFRMEGAPCRIIIQTLVRSRAYKSWLILL
jgi:hypothetical protein